MKSPLTVALLLTLGLSATPAFAAAPSAPATLATQSLDDQFKAIYEKEWAWRQTGGGEASEDSDAPANSTRLPDVSAAAQQARLKVWDEVLGKLKAIDPSKLSAENQINYAIYHYQVESLADEVRLGSYEMPFKSDSSFWSNLSFMARR